MWSEFPERTWSEFSEPAIVPVNIVGSVRLQPDRGVEGVQLLRGFNEIAFADDVVALEHRARLVAGQLHRDAFGDAGAHEIPNGRASKVVRNATRSSSFLACVPPGLREASDSHTFDLLPGPVIDARRRPPK